MTTERSFISAMLAELNRRKVLRTVGGYAVVVFVLLQLMDAAVEPLRLPDWVPTLVVLTLILGFPVVFMLAWLVDITPDGVRRTRKDSALSPIQTGTLFGAMLLMTLGLGYGFYGYYAQVFEAEPAVAQVDRSAEFRAPENSIAVLPFTDLSAGGDKAYLGDGIAEEILNLLAQVEGLRVAARTSSFAFRGDNHNVQDIGRQLNVNAVLEGSVRSDGDRVRLTAQLIGARDGFHIWSDTFDGELDDLFALQDEVATAIADRLVESFDGLQASAADQPNSNEAWSLYREGRLHWWRRNPESLETAIDKFAQAIEVDPFFAPACAALADSYLLLSSYGNISPIDANTKAVKLIDHAISLDPESAEAFAALGLARWQLGQMGAAESALRHSITLDDAYIPAQLWLAGLLGDLGRWPEQGVVLERAMLLDPLNELLAVNYANNLSMRGHGDDARQLLADKLRVYPASTTLLRSSAPLASQNGALKESWEYAQRAYTLEPDSPAVISAMAQAWIELDDIPAAEELLQKGLEQNSDNFDLSFQLVQILIVQGRFEEARGVLRDRFGTALDQLPEQFRGIVAFQYGLLAFASEDLDTAATAFDEALDALGTESNESWERTLVTMAAAVHQRLGHAEVAQRLIRRADRALKVARINGEDNPVLYYDEASLLAVSGQSERAIAALEQAYERGFRVLWLMRLDMRMESIRSDPAFQAVQARIAEEVHGIREDIRATQLASL